MALLLTDGAEPAPLLRDERIVAADAIPLSEDRQLVAVRPLRWEGRAIVYAGDREIDIRLRTRISREGEIVGESWPADQGEQALRRMTIDGSGGWLERGGKRDPMPAERLAHERQQFEFYAQLQPAIVMAKLVGSGETTVHGNVPTKFRFDGGWPIEASNRVSSPEPGGQPIDQKFLLSDYKTEGGFSWPRRIEIFHDGKPNFTLTIEKFEAGALP